MDQHWWDDKARELKEAVLRTHTEYLAAAERFKEIVKEGPSLPQPDGVHRMENAARVERFALQEYMKALKSFNDYGNRKT